MIDCEGLVKIYKTDDLEVVALQGLNLSVKDGELMAIIGNSGSGKSTLLNILGGLDRPSAGTVRVGPWDLLKITDEQLVKYKRETVGFIWQNNARNLLPYLSAIENVEMPMMLRGKVDRAYSRQLLEWVGLKERMHNKLHQLSGENNSGSRSRSRCPTGRRCCSPTSRPAPSTAARATSSWTFSARSTASSA